MADLAGALDATLRARYLTTEIRRPVTHKQGLTARLNALEKQFPTQKAMAAALGVSPRTIQRWRSGDRKPDAKSQRKILDAVKERITRPKVRQRLKKLPPPNSVNISAAINWNGYKNRTEYRHTTLGGMRDVMAHVIRAWFNQGPDAAAQAFEQGAAQVHNVPFIRFEGDGVEVSIPWEN